MATNHRPKVIIVFDDFNSVESVQDSASKKTHSDSSPPLIFWVFIALAIVFTTIVLLDQYFCVDWDKILKVFSKFCEQVISLTKEIKKAIN